MAEDPKDGVYDIAPSEGPEAPKPHGLEEPPPIAASASPAAAPAAEAGGVEDEAGVPLSREGFAGWQFLAGAGVAAMGAAALLGGIQAERLAHEVGAQGPAPRWWEAAGAALLWTPITAGLGYLGLALVGVASLERPVGDRRLALARMLLASALFHLVINLGIAPTGVTMLDRVLALVLAGGVALGAITLAFRLSADAAMKVFGGVAALWVLARLLWAIVPLLVGGPSKPSQAPPPVTPSPQQALPAAPR